MRCWGWREPLPVAACLTPLANVLFATFQRRSSMSTGTACECKTCGTTQWYDAGVCQVCHSDAGIQFTWAAKPVTGGLPSSAPDDTLALQPGASAQLVSIWTNLILVRGLTPVHPASSAALSQYDSPRWYRQRGVLCSVQFSNQSGDHSSSDQLNRAADWVNQSFVIRLVATFEAFAGGRQINQFQFPKARGMRELHFARRLRNRAAHGNTLSDHRDASEEAILFRSGAAPASSCSLDISLVLEPLWARLG